MDEFSFRNLNISTITINIESNIFFDLNLLVNIFLTLDKDKATEKTKELLLQNLELSYNDYKKQTYIVGTISYICYKDVWRGIKRRKKKKSTTRKRNDFVNQVTLDVFVEDNRRVNVMIFRNGKIKLAGCKNSNDAIIIITRLWELLKDTDVITKKEKKVTFVFVNEMINISFSLPFVINKIQVNKLFNKISNCISFYEQTGQQYVNVKMNTDRTYKKAINVEINESLIKLSISEILSKNPMKTCFMLFDKRVIMSGVDYEVMEKHFNEFKITLNENKDLVKI